MTRTTSIRHSTAVLLLLSLTACSEEGAPLFSFQLPPSNETNDNQELSNTDDTTNTESIVQAGTDTIELVTVESAMLAAASPTPSTDLTDISINSLPLGLTLENSDPEKVELVETDSPQELQQPNINVETNPTSESESELDTDLAQPTANQSNDSLSTESSETASEDIFSPPLPESGFLDLDTLNESSLFLMQAGFGGSFSEIEYWKGRSASEWVSEQLELPRSRSYVKKIELAYPGNSLPEGRPASKFFWDSMIQGKDELRKRMVYALSQIIVTSDIDIGKIGAIRMAYYMDILDKHAFGNYRDLLYDITYSPAMAHYLTYYRNRKANPKTRREPDENYARELMQLFTIGLVELNTDGTEKLDDAGNTIETYNNDDVIGLSRVFTGLSLNRPSFYADGPISDNWRPLKLFEEQHSEKEKRFLDVTIPAGTPGTNSINIAIDALFEHPNVAPFIARQLIQRFTQSNPNPDYVARVARAFDTGSFLADDGTIYGVGIRGDMKAMLAAILLDETIHPNNDDTIATTDGKIREPVLRLVHFLRAFNAPSITIPGNDNILNDTSSSEDKLAQHPMRSRSVFNFYRPGFVAPNTLSGKANLTTPELQIVTEGSVVGFLNFVTKLGVQRSKNSEGSTSLIPNYQRALSLADNPEDLVSHLSTLLTAGRLGDFDSIRIEEIVESIRIEEKTEQADRYSRVYAAVVAVMGSKANATH